MKTNDGGSAFPSWDLHSIDQSPTNLSGGMSLRDHFAGLAMQGWIACPNTKGGGSEAAAAEIAAEFSYLYADAMIRKRNQTTL